MAKAKIFAVFDVKAAYFHQPMFFKSSGEAIRGFSDAVNGKQEGNPYGAHPEDYNLFFLGEWESDTAKFELNDGGALEVARGLNLVVRE